MKRIVAMALAMVVVAGWSGECQAGPIRNLINNIRERRAERQAVPCQSCQPVQTAPAYQYAQPTYAVSQVNHMNTRPHANPFFPPSFLSGRICTGPNCPR